MDDWDYPQAMLVVDAILKKIIEEPEWIVEAIDLPCNLEVLASEFDVIYKRWLEDES